jgi:nitrogen fixation NifU-like protein
MNELRDLYQEVILDHSKNPRNRRKPRTPGRSADGHNPLCGDRITVYLTVEEGVVRDACFEGSGCAISTASASMMTEAVRGKPVDEVRALFDRFHELLTAAPDAEVPEEGLGKLAVFSGVREFPVRVKCATLAWHTLNAGLDDESEPVSTEGTDR